MIFTELPSETQEAMSYILGRYTSITESCFNRMGKREQDCWQMFCYTLAELSNKKDENAQKEFAEKFLKKLQ